MASELSVYDLVDTSWTAVLLGGDAGDKYRVQVLVGSVEVVITDGDAPALPSEAGYAEGFRMNDVGGANTWSDELYDSGHALYARSLGSSAKIVRY